MSVYKWRGNKDLLKQAETAKTCHHFSNLTNDKNVVQAEREKGSRQQEEREGRKSPGKSTKEIQTPEIFAEEW